MAATLVYSMRSPYEVPHSVEKLSVYRVDTIHEDYPNPRGGTVTAD